MNVEERNKLLVTELSALEILGLFHENVEFKKIGNISTFESLQEILSMVKVNVKYLLLDAEATHRELKTAKEQK